MICMISALALGVMAWSGDRDALRRVAKHTEKETLELRVDPLDDFDKGHGKLRISLYNPGDKWIRLDPGIFTPGDFLRVFFTTEDGRAIRFSGQDAGLFPLTMSETPVVLLKNHLYGFEHEFFLLGKAKPAFVRIVIEYRDPKSGGKVWEGSLRSQKIRLGISKPKENENSTDQRAVRSSTIRDQPSSKSI